MFFTSSLVSFLLIARAAAVPKPSDHDHAHNVRRALPDTWHQPEDHPVHALFKRAPGTDGVAYPSVGSPSKGISIRCCLLAFKKVYFLAWSAPYPQSTPDSNAIPAAWVNALNAAVAAGKIPDVPIPTQTQPNTNPIYPSNVDPNSQTICSGTYKCRIPGDIWDSPTGVFASSFDDGPSPVCPIFPGLSIPRW